MTSLIGLKITAGFILAVLSVAAGSIPIYLTQKGILRTGDKYSNTKKLWLSLLICFGGGVMMATLFIHVIPELTELTSSSIHSHIPIDYLLICGGLLLIYFIEEVVNTIAEKSHIKQCKVKKECDHPSVYIKPYEEEDTPPASLDRIFQTGSSTKPPHQPETHRPSSLAIFRNLLLIIALSLHAFFEGNIIGLEESSSGVYMLLVAVLIHKVVISFCMSLELLAESATKYSVLTYTLVFAMATFSGVVLGAVLAGDLLVNNKSAVWVKLSLQGVSAGALMYTTFFEILQRERAKQENGMWKYFAVLVGFVAMSVINILTHDKMHKDDE